MDLFEWREQSLLIKKVNVFFCFLNLLLTFLLDAQRDSKYILSLLTKAASEPLPEGIVIPESFEDLITEVRTKTLDSRTSLLKLKAMVCSHPFICH